MNISARKPTARRVGALNQAIFGTHRDAQVGDLVLANDLNHIILTEQFGGGADVKAIANTDGNALTPKGLRVFGQGIDETDSGLIHVAGAQGLSAITSATAEHTLAVGTNVFLQPDTNGPFSIRALFTPGSIAAADMFIGAVGAAADAYDPEVTLATTVITLVLDDLAGLVYDATAGDADRLYAAHNKSNEAATLATTAAGVDTGVDITAALTAIGITIDQDGNMTWSTWTAAAGHNTGVIPAALDADEEHALIWRIGSNTTATKAAQLHAIEVEYYADIS